jgi:hypothetical protein
MWNSIYHSIAYTIQLTNKKEKKKGREERERFYFLQIFISNINTSPIRSRD